MEKIIENFLDYSVIGTWKQDEYGVINVHGSVNIIKGYFSELDIQELPVKFGVVSGSFTANFVNLKSLKGFPIFIGGKFHCDGCPLECIEWDVIRVIDTLYLGLDSVDVSILPELIGDLEKIHFRLNKNDSSYSENIQKYRAKYQAYIDSKIIQLISDI